MLVNAMTMLPFPLMLYLHVYTWLTHTCKIDDLLFRRTTLSVHDFLVYKQCESSSVVGSPHWMVFLPLCRNKFYFVYGQCHLIHVYVDWFVLAGLYTWIQKCISSIVYGQCYLIPVYVGWFVYMDTDWNNIGHYDFYIIWGFIWITCHTREMSGAPPPPTATTNNPLVEANERGYWNHVQPQLTGGDNLGKAHELTSWNIQIQIHGKST